MIPWRNNPWPAGASAATTRTLLRNIELFCEQKGLTVTRFGKEAVGDPRLVGDLRNGRQLRASTYQRILAYVGNEPGA